MKNLIKISLLTMMAAGMLVGCSSGNKKDSGKSGLEAAATSSINTVGVAYGAYSSSSGISIGGAKLITEHVEGDYKFSISYTVQVVDKQYTIDYLKVENNKLVVEIPTFTELEGDGVTATYAAYKLNGSFKYAEYLGAGTDKDADKINKEIKTHSWNIRINAEKVKPVWQKISEARQKTKGETVVTTGYVTGFMNNVDGDEYKNGVWIADGNDGMMLYGGNLAGVMGVIEIGDMIMVAGTASPYNGLFEINPSSITKTDSAPEEIAQPVWKQLSESELGALAAVNANDPLLIKGATITADVDSLKADGAMTIAVKLGNTSINCYVNKHTNAAQREALVAHLKANKGKTVDVKSIGGWNSNTFQITVAQIVKNGNLNDVFTFAA